MFGYILRIYIPQGGFEPPQADPESAVLPLHNRGWRFMINAIKFAGFCQGRCFKSAGSIFKISPHKIFPPIPICRVSQDPGENKFS